VTVYVDDWRQPARVGRIEARWSHLTAGTKEELHAFAARLGLKRKWFQDKPNGAWHYGVTESRRRQAVRLGAAEAPWREFGEVWTRPGREGRPPASGEPGARAATAKHAPVQTWPAGDPVAAQAAGRALGRGGMR
jgi:Protein of unknown function (DUF4031)